MKQRVLIIDDDPPMLKQLARILDARTPYEVRTESNPLEVPGILERDEFDLIITDMGMPGLDGMEILRLVREQNRFEEVVIITAFGSLGSVLEAISAGVFDYIVKPFRKSQIVEVVNRTMRLQKRKREDLRLREVCAREPYSDAEAAFRSEYLRRRIEAGSADVESLARSSGLPVEFIALALKEAQASTESDEE